MMDDFLSHRESPRPAFARDLAAWLSAARPVQGARRGRVGLGLGAAGLSLLVAFGWGALGHVAGDSSVAGPTSAQPVALLLPVSGHPALVAASVHWTTVDMMLVAPPKPLSHHH